MCATLSGIGASIDIANSRFVGNGTAIATHNLKLRKSIVTGNKIGQAKPTQTAATSNCPHRACSQFNASQTP